MTSTNSSSNFLSTLKNNFRRNAALFAVFQVLIIAVFILHITNENRYYKNYGGDVTDVFASSALSFVAAVLGFEAIILAVSMFRGIYSKRASDYHFSLPIKRGVWFNANFLFGVISFAVSYAIFYIIGMIAFNSGIVKAFRPVHLDAGELLKYVVMSFAAVIVIYTVFVMCAVVAGRMWQYILLCFASSVVVYIGIAGVIFYINTVYGAWINLSKIYTVSAIELLFSDVTEISIWKYLIPAAAQFAVFYAAGYFSFKKRKAEVAENKLAGKVLPVVLTVVCFLSEAFVCLGIGNEISLFKRILAAVIAVAVTAVILSAIFFRKAISKPVLVSIAGTVILSVIFMLSVQFIPEKTYVYTIPEKDEIKSVSLINYASGSSSIMDILYGSSYLDTTVVYGENCSFAFSSDEAKDKMLQLHKKLLADETRNNVYSDDYYNNGNTSLGIEYKLENGKTIKRFYDVSTNDIMDVYADLLKTDEGINQLSVFEFKPADVLFVTVEDISFDGDYDELDQWDVINEASYENTVFMENIDVSKLYECIKKDLKNADSYRFIVDSDVYMDTGYEEYNDETGNWVKDVVYSENDLQLGFYKFTSKAYKEKLENLSPKEMLIADYKQYMQNDYSYKWIEESYISINANEYKNTVSYLKDSGYKF